MIHKVMLPEHTRRKLSAVVELQLAALEHAASAGKLCDCDLAKALDATATFRGCGEQIVAALKRGRRSTECSQRWQSLKNFATQTQGADYLPNPRSATLRDEKEEVIRRMRRDASALAIEGEPARCLEFYMPDEGKVELLPEGLSAICGFYESQLKPGTEGNAKYPDWLNARETSSLRFMKDSIGASTAVSLKTE